MDSIARTTTRPLNKDGRLLLEVEFDGGRTSVFEVDSERFYASLLPVLRATDTQLVDRFDGSQEKSSSFDPLAADKIVSPS